MDITVLKKITMGRTWGWVEDKSGHRLTLIPAVLVGFRSISFFLPPFSLSLYFPTIQVNQELIPLISLQHS